MQCPNCSKIWWPESEFCPVCNIDMKASYRYREALASAHFTQCKCDDGSCDWCSIYYADESELADLEPFLPVNKRAEVAKAKASYRQPTKVKWPENLCPVCGESVRLTGQTTDGRVIGSCGDAFKREAWEADNNEAE